MRYALFILFCAVAAFANAETPDDLFARAMREGVAKGVMTGPTADMMARSTRSTEPVMAEIARLEDVNDCQYFRLTITQGKIPSTSGGFVGDYHTVTKVAACRNGKNNPPPVVEKCWVGMSNCMPPATR